MQKGFKTFAEVVNFAIMREEEAYRFYLDLAGKVDDPFMKGILTDFAEEELKHQKILKELDVKGLERIFENVARKIDDLDIADNIKDVSPAPGIDFKGLLIVAMKREEKSQNLYSFLAEASADNDLSLFFVGLAKEEAKHKLRIEKTYKQLYEE